MKTYKEYKKEHGNKVLSFDIKSNNLFITGRYTLTESASNEEREFFKAVNDYLKEKTSTDAIDAIVCEIEYLSSRAMKELLAFLGKLFAKDENVTIIWRYEKDDSRIQEIGEYYKEVLLSYNFIMRDTLKI